MENSQYRFWQYDSAPVWWRWSARFPHQSSAWSREARGMRSIHPYGRSRAVLSHGLRIM